MYGVSHVQWSSTSTLNITIQDDNIEIYSVTIGGVSNPYIYMAHKEILLPC